MIVMKQPFIFIAGAMLVCGCSNSNVTDNEAEEINDSTTPLHLLTPDYTTPYGALSVDGVKADIDRVFNYIDRVTPTRHDRWQGEPGYLSSHQL